MWSAGRRVCKACMHRPLSIACSLVRQSSNVTGWSEKRYEQAKSSNLGRLPSPRGQSAAAPLASLSRPHIDGRARCASWTPFMIDIRAPLTCGLMVGCAARVDTERACDEEIFDTSQNFGLDRRRRLCASGVRVHSPLSTEDTRADSCLCTRCARSFRVYTRFALLSCCRRPWRCPRFSALFFLTPTRAIIPNQHAFPRRLCRSGARGPRYRECGSGRDPFDSRYPSVQAGNSEGVAPRRRGRRRQLCRPEPDPCRPQRKVPCHAVGRSGSHRASTVLRRRQPASCSSGLDRFRQSHILPERQP